MFITSIKPSKVLSLTSQIIRSVHITAIPFNLSNMKIGTHDGTFHCDEVLACYMLKSLPEYRDAEIVRTRNLDKLNECDIVVDVGGEFDHARLRYDHHQREFAETLSSLRPELGDKYKIKLSSAGLIYTFYGEKVIQALASNNKPLNQDDLKIIYKKVYEHFVEEIDAIDNGIPICDGIPKYHIRTHLSARVARLNPNWNNKEVINSDELFKKAMGLVNEDFSYLINYYTSVWLPARDIVKQAFDERFKTHESGKILLLNTFCPWKDHLFDLEEQMGLKNETIYVLFSDNTWRVQGVPEEPSSFVLRKPLHKNWQGLREEQLCEASNIEGCVFCHASGFIGGNKTKEGALQMAIASLEA